MSAAGPGSRADAIAGIVVPAHSTTPLLDLAVGGIWLLVLGVMKIAVTVRRACLR